VKKLIINADDFGFTPDVNAGIVHAHREGVLTSTTLMATGDAFEDAVRLAREHPTLDVGCHLVLVQGRSVVTGRALPKRPHDLLFSLFRGEIDVYKELRGQLQKIIDAGLRPSHLDSHKHTHIVPKVFRIVARLAAEYGIPWVRLPLDSTLPGATASIGAVGRFYKGIAEGNEVRFTDNFVGFRLTGSLTEDSFAEALRKLPDGTTEFMCHPGYLQTALLSAETRLKESRVRELEALTSPRIREVLAEEKIELTSFRA
jgi:predicted glycoside hydrolase/deacetylase ChbG (UPF0249 family)